MRWERRKIELGKRGSGSHRRRRGGELLLPLSLPAIWPPFPPFPLPPYPSFPLSFAAKFDKRNLKSYIVFLNIRQSTIYYKAKGYKESVHYFCANRGILFPKKLPVTEKFLFAFAFRLLAFHPRTENIGIAEECKLSSENFLLFLFPAEAEKGTKDIDFS